MTYTTGVLQSVSVAVGIPRPDSFQKFRRIPEAGSGNTYTEHFLQFFFCVLAFFVPAPKEFCAVFSPFFWSGCFFWRELVFSKSLSAGLVHSKGAFISRAVFLFNFCAAHFLYLPLVHFLHTPGTFQRNCLGFIFPPATTPGGKTEGFPSFPS